VARGRTRLASTPWRPAIILAALLVAALAPAAPAADAPVKHGFVTVTLQDGIDGYAGATDDGREGALKLMDDVKSADPKAPNPDYRHVIKFSGLEKALVGANIRVMSATLSLFYFDEFWSVNVYDVALQRSLDGTADRVPDEPEDIVRLLGDRFPDGQKTPRPSWVAWKLRPATIEGWLKDPASNRGLVLRVAQRDSSRGDRGNYGLHFRACGFGTPRERPMLTITYAFAGNLPPRDPTWDFRYRGALVGRTQVVRWHSPAQPDPDGDPVVYDLEVRPPGGAWQSLAKDLAEARYAWQTADLAAGDGYRLRVRARDPEGAASAWVEADGDFRIVRDDVAYQVGVATSLEKIRRDLPFEGEFGGAVTLALARGESESAQVVVANVSRALKGLAAEASDLRGPAGTIPKSAVTVRQVGYVDTKGPDKYSVAYVGLWADPLLEWPRVDVPPGKVQPLWVTVRAPKDAPAGTFDGTLTLTAEGTAPVTVPLKVTVWDFAIPSPGRFRAMVIDGSTKPAALDRLLGARLSPAYLLCGWTWDKPCPPVALAGGRWDFSEADRLGEYAFARGMNVFTIARFAKPGKFEFPKEYSAEFRARMRDYLAAYSKHLADKGWLKMGHVYNIDEPAEPQWPTCKENFSAAKAAAPMVPVMQCLNEPSGVAALAGSADIWDIYIGQFLRAGGPDRIKAGQDVIWAVCCYPATHPNLFIDYPAIDARIIGWLSWKCGVSGFEYWAANSWGENLKSLADRPYMADVEEKRWKANTFGNYNGDGYLLYPGPQGGFLGSIRLENLKDGFEDYEMLALLRDRVRAAKAKGKDVAEAEKLLAIDDGVCKADVTYTADPRRLLDARQRAAEWIVRLGE